jgi:hypothetical protein
LTEVSFGGSVNIPLHRAGRKYESTNKTSAKEEIKSNNGSHITANCSTEGAYHFFQFWALFDPVERMAHISLNSARIEAGYGAFSCVGSYAIIY